MQFLQRLFPPLAFFGGFAWDALTIGQRVKPLDLWVLGAFLLAAGGLILWLARREAIGSIAPVGAGWRERLAGVVWQAPYLLLQFFFGGIFSALFILYFKSSGYLGTWLTASLLGALLVANEFIGKHYGRRFTLVWALFALNAILFFNFALPHALGSLDPLWFYVSTVAGALLAHGLWRLAPGRPGRIFPAWMLVGALLLAWRFDMIAPVPLVRQDMAVGHDFVREGDRFALQVEAPSWWQFWRDQASTVQVPEGGKMYGVSAVFAPLGVTAALEHRWEHYGKDGWRTLYRTRFHSSGGRERGFRGYSWVLNPQPGEWRFIVATQDGRTIGVFHVTVERGVPVPEDLLLREF